MTVSVCERSALGLDFRIINFVFYATEFYFCLNKLTRLASSSNEDGYVRAYVSYLTSVLLNSLYGRQFSVLKIAAKMDNNYVNGFASYTLVNKKGTISSPIDFHREKAGVIKMISAEYSTVDVESKESRLLLRK